MPLSSALRGIPVGRRTRRPPALLLLVRLFIFSETARIGVLHGLRHEGYVVSRAGEEGRITVLRETLAGCARVVAAFVSAPQGPPGTAVFVHSSAARHKHGPEMR
jgi:hypothetical protein